MFLLLSFRKENTSPTNKTETFVKMSKKDQQKGGVRCMNSFFFAQEANLLPLLSFLRKDQVGQGC